MQSVTFVITDDVLMKKATIGMESKPRQTRVQKYHDANVIKQTRKTVESKNFVGRDALSVG